MTKQVKIAGRDLWPGLLLTPRATKTTTALNFIPTIGQVVVQRFNFGQGNRLSLGCSLEGNKAKGGRFLYSDIQFLQGIRDAGSPVPFFYHDDQVRSVLIVTVPENPVHQITVPELADEWSAASWYTGRVEMIQVG